MIYLQDGYITYLASTSICNKSAYIDSAIKLAYTLEVSKQVTSHLLEQAQTGLTLWYFYPPCPSFTYTYIIHQYTLYPSLYPDLRSILTFSWLLFMQALKRYYRVLALPLFEDNYSYIVAGTAKRNLVLVDPANPVVILKFLSSNFP